MKEKGAERGKFLKDKRGKNLMKSDYCNKKARRGGIVFLSYILLSLFFSVSVKAEQQLDYLSGDEASACEAILCLSSPNRPSECAPSLKKYFSIDKDKWSDTLKARINFLNLCPTASSPGMPNLVDAIANGAGFCDESALNKNTFEVYRIYTKRTNKWSNWMVVNRYDEYNYSNTCTSSDFDNSSRRKGWLGFGGRNNDDDNNPTCMQTKTIIDNSMPSRCLNLINNELTDYSQLVYEGDKFNGGKWVVKTNE